MSGTSASAREARWGLELGPRGETGPLYDMLRKTAERIGANIMGKRMFERGERSWPEEAPFHIPVYVLTREKRGPWLRPGGTTFFFVDEGAESTLRGLGARVQLRVHATRNRASAQPSGTRAAARAHFPFDAKETS